MFDATDVDDRSWTFESFSIGGPGASGDFSDGKCFRLTVTPSVEEMRGGVLPNITLLLDTASYDQIKSAILNNEHKGDLGIRTNFMSVMRVSVNRWFKNLAM